MASTSTTTTVAAATKGPEPLPPDYALSNLSSPRAAVNGELGAQQTSMPRTGSSRPASLDRPASLAPTARGVETGTAREVETWTEPRRNVFRLGAAFWCFFVMGANDAVYGAIIPYLESYYRLSYVVVSLVFLSPFAGYVASALLNNHLHRKLGRRGVAVISASSHLAAYVIIACHPPYVVLVLSFVLAGFGNGVADAAWNAWVGGLARSSELLGFLHALYGAGGAASPTLATTLVTKAGLEWYSVYYIMIGLAVVELVSLPAAFWDSTGAEYRRESSESGDAHGGLAKALVTMPTARVSWVAALFLLCYVGVEVALGGWIVTFMLRERHGDPFASGMSAVGFWLGITVGRAVLGFVTPRLGVKTSTAGYMVAAMALELVFWLVPEFVVSAVAVALQGFFLGPIFPNVVLVSSKLLPRHQHVVVIGFAAAFGGCGAALLPFLTGLLAQAAGVRVLQPVILALLGVMLAFWMCFPRIDKKRE